MKLSQIIRDSIIKIICFWKSKSSEFLREWDCVLEPFQELKKSKNSQRQSQYGADEISVRESIESKPNPAFREENESNAERQHRLEVGKFRLEGLAVFLGMCAFCVYIFQGCEAKRQADAAEKQLTTMQGQLQEMQEDRNLDERAWVLTTGDLDYDKTKGPDKNYKFNIFFKNTGKTPALKLQDTASWTTDGDQIPQKDDFPSFINRHEGVCGPSEIGFVETHSPIPGYIVDRIPDGQSVYIYGTIWYEDIFRGQHLSQFCFRLEEVGFDDANKMEFRERGLQIHNSCSDMETNQNN
jgi:hypothetical protein